MPINFDPKRPIKVDKDAFKKIVVVDGDIIIKTAQAYVEANVNVPANSNTYSVLKQESVFARVGVAVPDEGGFWVLLKKVNGIWVPLFGGQGLPLKDVGEKYGLPEGWYVNE